jgi:hypothetical protein
MGGSIHKETIKSNQCPKSSTDISKQLEVNYYFLIKGKPP